MTTQSTTTTSSVSTPPAGPIVFFDGTCGLCHRLVRFVVKHDRDGVFAFAPLQGSSFLPYRHQVGEPDLSTVVLVDESGCHTRSKAVVRILRRLGGPWGLVGRVASWVPRILRDTLYRAVARNRFRLFGRYEACDLPDAARRARFLP